ncbi:MAG: AbrB/MazE/SpoVT family DNA-binding domain-containing protein [Elusimicrobia bacterium]|nr:AbrB/MazE/SpoVT family DNA-binding domain-containing protein [Elusimicrobiota bacterium]
MTRAVLSTKYQLVIPREIRQRLNLRSGQRMMFLVKGGVITLVPERALSELKGIARGIKPGALREKRDRPA